MKIVATIEARMRSSRLPGKVVKPILGRPMLALLIERLQRVPEIDAVVVATTVHENDAAIEQVARGAGAECFRGSEEDVLDRVLQAARTAEADLIVEVTGDCPLLDPKTVGRVIRAFLSGRVDYCSNVIQRTYPRGMDIQVFPVAVLARVAELTQDPAYREHVSLYIYEHPEQFRLRNVESGLDPALRDYRLTVDTPEDFVLVQAVYEELYPSNPAFGLREILELFERRPDLPALNSSVRQKAVR